MMCRTMSRVGACLTLALAVLIGVPAGTGPAWARESGRNTAEIAVAELPPEARDTLSLIRRGGPFRYRQDGSVFGNRERLLPARERGYYREYTVATPGAKDRGARRIVTGSGPGRDVRTSGDYYYSDDHYNSFRRIRE
jgi:ribonuclease T1